MNPQEQEKLREFIQRALRDQPLRRAPRSLEGRVFASLAARQARPWWRRSYVHWPRPVQGAFVVSSALLAAVMVGLLIPGFTAPEEVSFMGGPLRLLDNVSAIAGAAGDFLDLVWRHIPAGWLYAGLALVVAVHATLIGLGALAYRTLFAPR